MRPVHGARVLQESLVDGYPATGEVFCGACGTWVSYSPELSDAGLALGAHERLVHRSR